MTGCGFGARLLSSTRQENLAKSCWPSLHAAENAHKIRGSRYLVRLKHVTQTSWPLLRLENITQIIVMVEVGGVPKSLALLR